ncbi:hypothetical protein [Pontibacter oryzae]|uniref:Uncharacterized protein n=1 Tax=Pontibacter oryzae TaxID=2304593 RepID=A0A399RQP1_9BACT|nr:hypothetical protein [Pontibacter oryzae]RIJ33448.1 hypothetical protein D1627_17690 [Pontibacter oryzae]
MKAMVSQPIRKAGEITWLLLILLVLFPAFTAFLWQVVQVLFNADGADKLNLERIDLNARMTLFYFGWSFFLFVLLPYSLAYRYTRVNNWPVFFQLLLFYMLLLLMGILLPYASIIDLYNTVDPYPRVLVLYLLLTLTLGPLVNIPLRWRLRRQSNSQQV